jgi:hypothetical protein
MKRRLVSVMFLVLVVLFSGCQGQVEGGNEQSTGLNYTINEDSLFRSITKDGYEDIELDDDKMLLAIEKSIPWFEDRYSFDYKNIDLSVYEGDELKKYEAMVDGEVMVVIDSLEIGSASRYTKENDSYVAFNYHIVSVMEGGKDIYFAELSRKNNKNITRGYEEEAYGIIVLKESEDGYVVENSAHVTLDTFNSPHVPEMMFGK